jgi:hypothetical protein
LQSVAACKHLGRDEIEDDVALGLGQPG